MGNALCNYRAADVAIAGKVILSDGTVVQMNEVLTAAELMLEHPGHVVMQLDPRVDGSTLLPADTKLHMKGVYLMVPIKPGGKLGKLSSSETRRMVFAANQLLRSGNVDFLPWLTKVCPAAAAGKTRLPRVGEKQEASPESLEGSGESLSRQLSGRSWKPNLDTIIEKNHDKKKLPHWVLPRHIG